MDIRIAHWIVEFMILQPIEDCVVNTLLYVLPLSDNDLRLKKAILLRRISSEVSNGSVSERVLESLERIEELEYMEGNSILESMKEAYCAVAVDCTVRLLREGPGKRADYFDSVKRTWMARIGKMISGKAGLVSEQLKETLAQIEATKWSATGCQNVLNKDTRNDALRLLKIFLNEAREAMFPSFLEFTAEKMNEMGLEKNDFSSVSIPDQVGLGQRAASSTLVPEGDKNSEMPINIPTEDGKKVMLHSSSIARMGVDTACNKYDCLPTPEVSKIQEALKSSTSDLQTLVKDPLLDALHIAETVLSNTARENMNHKPSEENQDKVDAAVSSHDNEGIVEVQAKNSNIGNQSYQNMPRPSLMERNSTARTYEWDDAQDRPEGSSSHSEKVHLPSPKKRSLSPLKKYETMKFARRRKTKRWSSLEEETLRAAVEKYGRGNWKFILISYRDVFEERTEVDLKDKWRNMTR
ncbi:PREDICTED: uncharacterized protein LOC104594499 [Nelumbo nucifera]|uniref:Telomeric repeat-binding factor 2-like n=2 Tax=Nelumbo nucifera TaxID=4432 RepID=A0A822Y3D5_NELNU|nr:PREDICTED: uncharacterized protein LOC104594499 [Nelumbo nucifera]DAD25799.1 TPA_asm: hypothetical protein HUJ06_027267 [Nelumbo nucifera]